MNHEHLETQVAAVVAYVRAELGYDGESPGSLRRQVEEHDATIRSIEGTLRGRGDELGLVGWMMVLRRTWITMVALLGAAAGYVMNVVVDALQVQDRAQNRHSEVFRGIRPDPSADLGVTVGTVSRQVDGGPCHANP